jgi:hypothetical protein
MSCINCILAICGRTPYPENSVEGKRCAIIQRIAVGLILTSVLVIGTYFLGMSLSTIENFGWYKTIGLTVGFGVSGVLLTSVSAFFATF